jgi:23S rRNA pseudouridine2605 synthase
MSSSRTRLAKLIARSGLCSRRSGDSLIKSGRVTLGGRLVSDPGIPVREADAASILVDGRPLPAAAPTQVWAVHKLKGELVTRDDPAGRPTLSARLEKMGLPPGLRPVGRLDYHTEGLLLHTNDGDLARYLELPKNAVGRRYLVLVKGAVQRSWLRSLAGPRGSVFGGVRYRPIQAQILRTEGANRTWLDMTLTEGKNREIRRILKCMKLEVKQLVRIAYGPYELGELAPGAAVEVPLKFDPPAGPNGGRSHAKAGWKREWERSAQGAAERAARARSGARQERSGARQERSGARQERGDGARAGPSEAGGASRRRKAGRGPRLLLRRALSPAEAPARFFGLGDILGHGSGYAAAARAAARA